MSDAEGAKGSHIIVRLYVNGD